jgi:hypothetical protein
MKTVEHFVSADALNLNLLGLGLTIDLLNRIFLAGRIINTNIGMMSILNMKQVTTLLDMIGTAEENVDFFEWDTLRFRY